MNLLDIESRVFSRIRNKYPTELKTKYPDTYFTTSDRVATNPKFPTVYVHEMNPTEEAQDLENMTLNAITSTFQIEVTDNSSMSNATEVMNYVVGVMKTMRYGVISMPEFSNTTSVFRKVARFRRVIGSGDVL